MQIQRKYHLFDAQGKILGRLSSEIAVILMGKNKADYQTNLDQGDFVVVVNSNEIEVSGHKVQQKIYHRYSGYPGGLKSITFEKQKIKDSRRLISGAVSGMLPKNKLRALRLKRLLVYCNEKHSHKIEIKH